MTDDPLRCVECHAEAPPDADGWRAYVVEDEVDAIEEVAVYCPECAAMEFGGQ